MTSRRKAYTWLRSHDIEELVAEVQPALFGSSTWYRFGSFHSKDGEIVRGIELSGGHGFGVLVRLVPLTNDQIEDSIDLLSRVHDQRESATWKLRSGLFRFHIKFRKFLEPDIEGREIVKMSVTVFALLSFSWSPQRMTRAQIKMLIEGLKKLKALPEPA